MRRGRVRDASYGRSHLRMIIDAIAARTVIARYYSLSPILPLLPPFPLFLSSTIYPRSYATAADHSSRRRRRVRRTNPRSRNIVSNRLRIKLIYRPIPISNGASASWDLSRRSCDRSDRPATIGQAGHVSSESSPRSQTLRRNHGQFLSNDNLIILRSIFSSVTFSRIHFENILINIPKVI